MEISLETYYLLVAALGIVIGVWVLYRERHPRKPPRS